jgi:1,4-alpha-glucan branching enzyme
MLRSEDVWAIARAEHGDPFAILGPHETAERELEIRAFLPQAGRVEVIDATSGKTLSELERIQEDGFFNGVVPGHAKQFPYRLRLRVGDHTWDVDDPYRFGPLLGDVDVYLIGEGRHLRLYDVLGAHLISLEGVAGVSFAVWAPNAARVSVVGNFNDWDGRRNPMRVRGGSGIWEIFLPDAREGATYKFEIRAHGGAVLPLRADPFAFASEHPPATGSVVAVAGSVHWTDGAWLGGRGAAQTRDAPISIYEVHLGSWKRADGNRYLTYRELADELVPYATGLGFTHIELLPIAEHPFDGSWGYQTIGMFSPTSRFGTPEEFAAFVDRAHEAGLGVLLDWVPGHFPTDAHGLGTFDGTHLYEHADPRQGFQPDWNTLIFNFDRNEVVNYLISNALFWIERYHVDGLRVDAVASMLYLDFSRKADAWIPNRFGGRENLGAVDFLRRTNEALYGANVGAVTMAEESSAWPKVSAPVYLGGLGFGYKWNMGWMHDSLDYIGTDPLYRTYEQDHMTFAFTYAATENFVLPLSHDEVVHGKGSLIGKMPGDDWQRFANLRAYFGFMYAHPGKKLLFMGGEFAQEREWNHDRSLDWHLLDYPRHAGMLELIRDLNHTYRGLRALYELDSEAEGVEFIRSDKENAVIAFVRRGREYGDYVVAVTNFTPLVRYNYRFGVPDGGAYGEAINTDDVRYGGSGVANGHVNAEHYGIDGKPYSLNVTLPPLATVLFKRL